MATIQAGSQNARILDALKDGRWHSVADIHRHAGTMRLNSRVSELRTKHGYTIEHRVVSGKARASYAHQYRLLNPPLLLPSPHPKGASPAKHTVKLDRESVPRDDAHRFRIYRRVRDRLELVAAAPTPEQVGVELVALGRKGEFGESCVGLLDTFGVETDVMQGTWLLNPWDTEPQD